MARAYFAMLCLAANALACGSEFRSISGSGGAGGTGGTDSSGSDTQSNGSGGSHAGGGDVATATASTASQGGSGGTLDSSSTGIVDFGCPRDVPDAGSPCTEDFGGCDYGDDLRMGCRTRAYCENGVWLVSTGGCPPIPTTTCGAVTTTNGAPCAEDGAVCASEDGSQCGCTGCAGGPCTDELQWVCSDPPDAGCPAGAPNMGQPCEHEIDCRYGVCGVNTAAERECKDGRWRDNPVACPE